jgi:hypothetical protein
MKHFFVLIIFFVLFSLLPIKVFAINDPLKVSNNRFGIHITDMSDLRDASSLVNSSGGDWGYVTFVIQSSDRNKDYWQYLFDECRKLHLIPLVRIATKPVGDTWEKPDFTEIDDWVSFLNSLNWVVENRYVIIGNEPNHAKEWGNTINPIEYANYLVAFSTELKKVNTDFFVLPAGLDLSAPNSKTTMDSENFLRQIYINNPNYFNFIDGWTSHSYPNPDFTGSVDDTGRKSIRGYLWEVQQLKNMGVLKEYPTGWAKYNKKLNKYTQILSEGLISDNFVKAFKEVWNSPNIVAVTPFVLNYQSEPFIQFSWKQNNLFLSYFEQVKAVQKTAGEPKIIEKVKIRANYVFPFPDKNNNFKGVLIVENMGESIIDTSTIALKPESGISSIKTGSSFSSLEPFDTGVISYELNVPVNEEVGYYSFAIYRKGNEISDAINVKLNTPKTLEMKMASIFDKIRALLGL